MPEFFRLTLTMKMPSGVTFSHTFRELPGPEGKARRKARALARKMWPSARCRAGRMCHDRKAEKRALRSS